MPPRCFLALTVPDRVASIMDAARETFVSSAPGWAGERWVASPRLHVTLAFLGPLDGDEVGADVRRMRRAAALVPVFDLRLDTIAAVPSTGAAAMVWATRDDPEGALRCLRDALIPAFPSAEVDHDRPWRPHVTLARARRPRRVEQTALARASALVQARGKGSDGIVSVRSVTLFSSTLRPAGPEYRELAVAELAR